MEKIIGSVLSPRLPHRFTNRQRKEGFVKKRIIAIPTTHGQHLESLKKLPASETFITEPRAKYQYFKIWQRMEDSNLRMLESKSSALPTWRILYTRPKL